MTRWIGSYCIKYQFGISLVRNAQPNDRYDLADFVWSSILSSARCFLPVQNNNNNNKNMNDSDIYIGPIYVDLFINVES